MNAPARARPQAIGVFDARQRRERWLVKTNYTHRVVVFDTAVVMVEVAPIRDLAVAALKYGSLPLHLVPHAKPVEYLALALLRLSPEPGLVDSKWAQIQNFTPDGLEAAFPHHVHGLDNDQITAAVLKRFPPAELELRYNSSKYAREMQLWLSLSGALPLDNVSHVMSEVLGDRFREAAAGEALWRTARNLLPGRGLIVTTR